MLCPCPFPPILCQDVLLPAFCFLQLTNSLLSCFQTLGHLEKAVVLELTLKHVKALTSLIEQQQQQIIALQKGLHAGEYMLFNTFSIVTDAFHIQILY